LDWGGRSRGKRGQAGAAKSAVPARQAGHNAGKRRAMGGGGSPNRKKKGAARPAEARAWPALPRETACWAGAAAAGRENSRGGIGRAIGRLWGKRRISLARANAGACRRNAAARSRPQRGGAGRLPPDAWRRLPCGALDWQFCTDGAGNGPERLDAYVLDGARLKASHTTFF
jgi:hypothetical protein